MSMFRTKQVVQGNKAFYALLNKIRKLQLPIDLSLQLFDNLVLPVLLYGCEVWGYGDIIQIQILHRKFIKTLLGVYTSTPNVMVYGESGQFDIKNHVVSRMITFYMRLVNGNHNKISYIMYRLLRTRCNLDDNYDVPWIKMISNNLSLMGMRDIWESQGLNFTTEYVKQAVKLRLKDVFLQEWSNELQLHEYCDNYRLFKKDWQFENYLVDLNYYQRQAICKFRCRSNHIPVCRSRFTKCSHDDMICPLCDIHEIADESHLLFHCKFFTSDREKCFKSGNLPTIENIFQTTTPNLRNLANFIQNIMDVFKNV